MNHITTRRRFWITITLLFLFLVSVWAFYFFVSASTFEVPAISPSSTISAVGGDEVVVHPVRFDGYLLNPGMGWQADNSPSAQYFSESVAYADREKITWKNLNPAENVYDWSSLSSELARAISQGKQLSFRVFTMSGESYGGHQVPDWVLQKGAVILSHGEPDYSNCVYQEEWGKFVVALLERYDGDPSIAFIDISGYGNFNEWSWRNQTEWDSLWDENYINGTANSTTLQTLDGQARRRLADMFIGGSFSSHQCRTASGVVLMNSYAYAGAQKTQLILPYAGILQSTQYVFLKRKDVGFRYDCLGRQIDLPGEVSQIWRAAPVIYELCSSEDFDANIAQQMMQNTHPVLIHNNNYDQSLNVLQKMIISVGYRFFLKEARFKPIGQTQERFFINMIWQNLGTSIPYKKMGQRLSLHLYFVDQHTNQVVYETIADADTAAWLPSDWFLSVAPPEFQVNVSFVIPETLPAGEYSLEVSLLDERTGAPVQLAMNGLNSAGRYYLSVVKIVP